MVWLLSFVLAVVVKLLEILMVINGFATWWQGNKKSLADKFEYVMHGKLYRISEEGSGKHVKAYVLLTNPL